MARVFQKRGEWWVDYRDAAGRRRRKPIGDGASHSLAQQVLAQRLAAAAEHRHFPARAANSKTFGELLAKFRELHVPSLRQRGLRSMLGEIERTLGARRLREITAEDVRRYYNTVAERASPATANRHLGMLQSIYSRGKEWGIFHGESPCASIKKLREPAHRLRFLSQEEMRALLEVAHPRLYPVLVCALHTGMRKGEILGLRWENVSMDRSTIYVLKAKSGKPREIPITGRLLDVLGYLGSRPAGPVFDLPDIMLRRYFAQALGAARIAGFRFHDLRHYADFRIMPSRIALL